MVGSQTLGVRIPEHVLATVDRFAKEKDLTRSMAIAVLVERALSDVGMAPEESAPPGKPAESGTQDSASGRRAQQWGTRTAREIAAVLGAEKATDQPQANEFLLDGKRVAIKCARPKTNQCGLTNTMRDRVDCIICASQTAGGMFNLYKVTPEQWEENATHPPKHNRNYGTLTHLSRSAWRRIGEDLGEVVIDG